jgi:hypothetical protein
MKKKLSLSILFMTVVVCYSIAQINQEFLNSKPKFKQYQSSYELPELSENNYTLQFTDFQAGEKFSWIQTTTHRSYIDLKNVLIRTDHNFDINGMLRSSTMNIEINRVFAYKIFPFN